MDVLGRVGEFGVGDYLRGAVHSCRDQILLVCRLYDFVSGVCTLFHLLEYLWGLTVSELHKCLESSLTLLVGNEFVLSGI